MDQAFVVRHCFSFRKNSIMVSEHCPPKPAPISLLFIHGRFSYSEFWHLTMSDLRHDFRCISIDLPGFGYSFNEGDQPPSLVENGILLLKLIQNYFPEPLFLISHDIGAAMAQLCTIQGQYVDNVDIRGNIVVNPLTLNEALPPISLSCGAYFLRKKIRKALGDTLGEGNEHGQMISVLWNNRDARRSMIRSIESLYESWPQEQERLAWRAALKTVKTPTLVLAGSKDPFAPNEHSLSLFRNLKDASYFENEICGHWPCLENPGWVLNKARSFLWQNSLSKLVRKSLWR